MIITVSGSAASGKTTLAEKLSSKLGFKHISAGRIMREMAQEKDMTLLEFSAWAENHPEVDEQIDGRQKQLSKDGDCVVDGRLSGWFLNANLAVWLWAPVSERARRVIGRGEEYETLQQAVEDIKAREESEKKRYKKYYDIDLDDLSCYDLVLNTHLFGITEMTELTMHAVKLIKP
ncbi:MAG: AAA family ATPase [Candidatus Altiarchaeales archaeon]|nr:AAA family ATPase [Candidatus Altiarchaeales archaeon]